MEAYLKLLADRRIRHGSKSGSTSGHAGQIQCIKIHSLIAERPTTECYPGLWHVEPCRESLKKSQSEGYLLYWSDSKLNVEALMSRFSKLGQQFSFWPAKPVFSVVP
jgi:hypothetical protein